MESLTADSMKISPIWFDSLGAKSSSVLIECKEFRILIDPGVAVMHPSYPAPRELKIRWAMEGREKIRGAARLADLIIITHYHYDHYTDFDEVLYRGKTVLAKNPNEYINDSQRNRALKFYSNFFKQIGGLNLSDLMDEPVEKEYSNPLDELHLAMSRDYGDYTARKMKLLKKGFEWFRRRAKKWGEWRRIPEHIFGNSNTKLFFIDGREFTFNSIKIRFTKPLFHGIEFSRVGWVVSVVIEYGKHKFLYSSDLNGPIIEDYADWIIREKPDFIVLDGPMTYMLGYTLNKINLRRAVENAVRIVRESGASTIIYDHHLPRERKFREHTIDVWHTAEREGVKLVTAAEFLGMKPVILIDWDVQGAGD